MTKRSSASGPIDSNSTAYVELAGGSVLTSLNPEGTGDDETPGSIRRTTQVSVNVAGGTDATAQIEGIAAGQSGQELLVDMRLPLGGSRQPVLRNWANNALLGEKVLLPTQGKAPGGGFQFDSYTALRLIYTVEPAVDSETPAPEPYWKAITAIPLPISE